MLYLYGIGDIVRFNDKSRGLGLHEITGVKANKTQQYTVTKDECASEFEANHEELILVCTRSQRRDL